MESLSWKSGVRRLALEAYSGWVFGWTALTNRYPIGSNIFSEDWDCAIILDACRVDAIREVADEYQFIESIDSRISVGSTSKEWMFKTFVNKYKKEIENTTYITDNTFSRDIALEPTGVFNYIETKNTFLGQRKDIANSFVKRRVIDIEDLGGYDPVWKYMPSQNPYGSTSLLSDVTDKAIHTAREDSPDRLLIHYMQPHDPFLARAIETESELHKYERHPFDELRAGNINEEQIWEAYLDNLRLVLNEVERLLSNIDAERVLITADHGELFGEYLHSHAPGILYPDLKRVPWVMTTAENEGTCDPDPISRDESNETDPEQRLKDLGYL